MERLWAITCYFNPVGYERRLRNYLAFRRKLTIPLVAVELSYRDAFDLPPDAAELLIRLRGRDVLWQKERLLNLALAKLPGDCTAVTWLDCDVVFERDNWAEQALRALQRVPLLQPFQRVYEPPADSRDPCGTIPSDAPLGDSLAHLQSLGLVTSDMLQGAMRLKSRSNSGLAWVARREVIDRDGFYDACVMGSGNRAMVCAALGTPADAIRYICMTPAWAEHYRAWATRHLANVRGSIGFTEGTLIHLWHGELNDRRYQERHRAFSAYDFDPNADIALDENGSWRWSSEKRAMHACVADYFRSRREDGV